MRNFILTSESVTAGHPDKLCDQICDAIVDAHLMADPVHPVTAECAIANGIAFLSVRRGAEIEVDLNRIVREVIDETGYRNNGFSADTCTILTNTSIVSSYPTFGEAHFPASHAITTFGYACRHTDALMPYSIVAAHQLTRALDEARREGRLGFLLPDGQGQVAVVFEDRQPVAIHSLTLTTSLDDTAPASDEALTEALREAVVDVAFAGAPVPPSPETRIVARRAGPSPAGGPANHAGLTGRKNTDDNYGGYARQTSAALSGKDPFRIDRIATYAARHIAKCVVAADLADECEVQLSYAAGDAAPINFEVEAVGADASVSEKIARRVGEIFDLRVAALIERFDLSNAPRRRNGRFFRDLAVYGQIGRTDIDCPWENVADAALLA